MLQSKKPKINFLPHLYDPQSANFVYAFENEESFGYSKEIHYFFMKLD